MKIVMENEVPAQNMSQIPHGKPSLIHVILVLLSLLTLGGIGYITWQIMTLSEVMQRSSTTDTEVARLQTQLTNSEAALAAEKASSARTTVAQDHILYEDRAAGYRIVTTSDCKDVYRMSEVTSQNPNVQKLIGLFLPQATAQEWPANTPWYHYAVVKDTQAYEQIKSESVSTGVVPTLFLKDSRLVIIFQPQDGPGDRATKNSAGKECHEAIQALP